MLGFTYQIWGEVALRIGALPIFDQKLICAFSLGHQALPGDSNCGQIDLFNLGWTGEAWNHKTKKILATAPFFKIVGENNFKFDILNKLIWNYSMVFDFFYHKNSAGKICEFRCSFIFFLENCHFF